MHQETILLGGMKVSALVGGAVATAASVATGDWSVFIFGVQLPILLAAFGGSIVSLSFIAVQRAWWATIGAGTLAGAYATPLVAHAVGFINDDLHRGVAFGIGLLLQVIIPSAQVWIARKGSGNA